MANYKETTGQASAYTRCNRIFIDNPLVTNPLVTKKVQFNEEQVFTIDGNTIVKDNGGCTIVFDPTQSFPMVDTETLEPTGVMVSHIEAYVMLFSMYIAAAKKRDELNGIIAQNQELINQLAGNP